MNAEEHIEELANFESLDLIFEVDPNSQPEVPADPDDVLVFTGAPRAALYVGGVLHASGEKEDVVTEALIILGAKVYSSDEHLLGNPGGPAAPDVGTIEAYSEKVEKVEELRSQADSLRAEADTLEGEIRNGAGEVAE